jgi:hypothetical protein
MSYDKKTWVNVDDPSKFTNDQLNEFPRFDADNMNRIEAGIVHNEERIDYLNSLTSIPSYLTFVGNANADMIAAAFGKGNEDEVPGVGKALTMYSNYKEEALSFRALQNCNSVIDIVNSPDAISEVLSSPSITSLMRACAYTAPYADLWVLNDTLPDEYRGNSFADIVQNKDALAYMYNNYTDYEALGVLSSNAFFEAAAPYASEISKDYTTKYNDSSYSNTITTVYGKKCIVLRLYINTMSANSTGDTIYTDASDYISIGHRPGGSTIGKVYRDGASAAKSICSGEMAENLKIATGYCRHAKTYYYGNCKAIILPCE